MHENNQPTHVMLNKKISIKIIIVVVQLSLLFSFVIMIKLGNAVCISHISIVEKSSADIACDFVKMRKQRCNGTIREIL